jgi:PBP1b-binding outer membrane lipoprotein LpoB
MKNLFKVLSTLLLSALLFSACSTLTYQGDAKTEGYEHFKKNHDLKAIHKVIMKTGEEEGWRMTEFKYNSILAEKVLDDETKAVTIDFTEDSLIVLPEDDDLEESLIEALDK